MQRTAVAPPALTTSAVASALSAHTALPTMTTAEGPGSEILEGMTDNTEIGVRLKGLYAR